MTSKGNTDALQQRNKLILFGTAAAVRLSLAAAFPALPDLLTGRVEISTPVTSFKRCTSIAEAHSRSTAEKEQGAEADDTQCRRACSSTTMACPLMTEVSSTRYHTLLL